MTPSVTEVPPELQGLPQVALDAIHAACAGDWRRVVPTGRGEYVVHNQPQMRRVELPTVAPRRTGRAFGKMRWSGTARPVSFTDGLQQLPQDMTPAKMARVLAEAMTEGVPEEMVRFGDNLEDLAPMMRELVLSACRLPERVWPSPRSAELGHPRVHVKQGDIEVVISINDVTELVVVGVRTLR